MKEPEFIVAEITTTWARGGPGPVLISKKFEDVIERNMQRGYVLYSFSHSQVLSVHEQQETIIAVFRKDLTEG